MKKTYIILIIIATFLYINISNRILVLENKLSEMQGIMQDIYRYSDETNSMITKNIEENSLVNKVDFKFKGANNQTSMLDVFIDLNRVSKDSEVIFLYKESNKNDWIEVKTTKESELSYSTQIEVKQQSKLYEYKVCIIGNESESSEVFYLEESIYGPKLLDYSASWSDSDFEISVNSQGIEDKYLDTFVLTELYVRVNTPNEIHQLDLNKNNNYTLRITDKKMLSSRTKIYLVSKYSNDLVREQLISEY